MACYFQELALCSQPSRKVSCPWAGGAYGLTFGHSNARWSWDLISSHCLHQMMTHVCLDQSARCGCLSREVCPELLATQSILWLYCSWSTHFLPRWALGLRRRGGDSDLQNFSKGPDKANTSHQAWPITRLPRLRKTKCLAKFSRVGSTFVHPACTVGAVG